MIFPKKDFEMHTDASKTQLGAVLAQESKTIALNSEKDLQCTN